MPVAVVSGPRFHVLPVSSSHLFGGSVARKNKILWFYWETTSGTVSTFWAYASFAVLHDHASVHGGCGIFSFFYVKVDSDPSRAVHTGKLDFVPCLVSASLFGVLASPALFTFVIWTTFLRSPGIRIHLLVSGSPEEYESVDS